MASFPDADRPAADCETMAHIRAEIDRLDRILVTLIAERQTYVERAGHIKPDRDAVYDPERVEDVITKVKATAAEAGASPDLVEKTWRAMVDAFIAHEFDIYDQK